MVGVVVYLYWLVIGRPGIVLFGRFCGSGGGFLGGFDPSKRLKTRRKVLVFAYFCAKGGIFFAQKCAFFHIFAQEFS